jgi:hypothetical protein
MFITKLRNVKMYEPELRNVNDRFAIAVDVSNMTAIRIDTEDKDALNKILQATRQTRDSKA